MNSKLYNTTGGTSRRLWTHFFANKAERQKLYSLNSNMHW